MPAEPVMRPTGASVADHLAAVEPAQRRIDGQAALALHEEITGEPAVMWGPSIVGFGSYRGKTGVWPIAGFAARKAEMVFYALPEAYQSRRDLMDRLGKHRIGVSCLYIKKLADVDIEVLRELLTWSVETMRARYPA